MVKKLKYERPLMQNGTHRYMGPSIYKGTVTNETFNTIVKMVADSQESVKDKLCHTTSMNNRLEFQEVPEHFDALGEIFQHVSRYTRSLNTCDWREVEDLNLDNVWMNVQHANQSIGHHTHEEADYAFVIYVRNTLTDPTIGYTYEDRSVNDPVDGMIEWRYGETHFLSPNRMLHFPEERDIVVFPGWLEHQVYPFKQEGADRISVAGNINTI